MIYVDMKCFYMKKNLDIKFDEKISVDELLDEIGREFPFKTKNAQLLSVNNRQVLKKDRSFCEQGVLGGDTLILIEG